MDEGVSADWGASNDEAISHRAKGLGAREKTLVRHRGIRRDKEPTLVVSDDAQGIGEAVKEGEPLVKALVDLLPIAVRGWRVHGREIISERVLNNFGECLTALGIGIFKGDVVADTPKWAAHTCAIGSVDDTV